LTASTSDESRREPMRPVVAEVRIPLSGEGAFRLFTDGISTWWPLKTHSVYGDDARGLKLEPHAGGRLFETGADESQAVWGRVKVWEPPYRLVLSWHPGRDADSAQELDISFAEDGRSTLVRIEHRDWDRLGSLAGEVRARYENTWSSVLGRFEAAGRRG
jgi:uncharacterized protein YndB with AHSA1/START domain